MDCRQENLLQQGQILLMIVLLVPQENILRYTVVQNVQIVPQENTHLL